MANAYAKLNEECRGGATDASPTACDDAIALEVALDKMQGPIHGKFEKIVQDWFSSAVGSPRQAALENKLDALGCSVNMEEWECPVHGKTVFIIPGWRSIGWATWNVGTNGQK